MTYEDFCVMSAFTNTLIKLKIVAMVGFWSEDNAGFTVVHKKDVKWDADDELIVSSDAKMFYYDIGEPRW